MHLIQAIILFLSPSIRARTRAGKALRSLVIAALFLCGCTFPHDYRPEDLREMPQQPAAYLDSITANIPLMDKDEQRRVAHNFLVRHFSPWSADAPLEETTHPFWALEWLESKHIFGHNLLPLEHKAAAALQQRCDAASYPSILRYAISVVHTDVRALPTAAPIFRNPHRAGEGFPFDYMQHGVLPAGTPILATHTSRDGTWFFIETPLLSGWVPATAVAWVDDDFKDAYTSAEYITILEDGHMLRGAEKGALPSTRAGTILPVLEHTDTGYMVAIPHVNMQGYAMLERAIVPGTIAEPFPLPLTPARIAKVSSHFMHQPYSWGDRFNGRDCSGTMRDIFTPFGLWLPRNSGDQARVGRVIDLEAIPAARRRSFIANQAVPFATLLHVPGHIMLYLGTYAGKSAVLHTAWGIRTRSLTGAEGRIRIGETAITSLEPGKEMDGLRYQISSLLERLDQMNILLLPKAE